MSKATDKKGITFSIRVKYALMLVAVMAGVIAAISLINNRYLESYYVSNKKQLIYQTKELINHYIDSSTDEEREQYQLELMKVCNRSNIDAIIINSKNQDPVVVFSNGFMEINAFSRLTSFMAGKLTI